MAQRRLKETHIVEELRSLTDRKRGLVSTASDLGFTPQYIHQVVNGHRGVSERLAEAMGYRRVIEYERSY
jgi:hypothetical protein